MLLIHFLCISKEQSNEIVIVAVNPKHKGKKLEITTTVTINILNHKN
ncbi:MAG: hypothetical protein KJO73_13525 [Croceitalea sp.]|nr:hypothetical protein [Croceitalea sp.]